MEFVAWKERSNWGVFWKQEGGESRGFFWGGGSIHRITKEFLVYWLILGCTHTSLAATLLLNHSSHLQQRLLSSHRKLQFEIGVIAPIQIMCGYSLEC